MKSAIPIIEILFALCLLVLAGASGWTVFLRCVEGSSGGTQAKPGTVLLCMLFVVSSFYGLAILEELFWSLTN